jgi:hypothetical protein
MRLKAQVQCRNQVQLGFEFWTPLRAPSMGPERLQLQWPERLRFPALLWRPLPVPERGPLRGQALAQLSGRRLRRRIDRAISDE